MSVSVFMAYPILLIIILKILIYKSNISFEIKRINFTDSPVTYFHHKLLPLIIIIIITAIIILNLLSTLIC